MSERASSERGEQEDLFRKTRLFAALSLASAGIYLRWDEREKDTERERERERERYRERERKRERENESNARSHSRSVPREPLFFFIFLREKECFSFSLDCAVRTDGLDPHLF